MRLAVVLLLASTVALHPRAYGDPTDTCIHESEEGQRLLLTHHLVESQPHLVACGAATCPAAISRDCIERLHQAEASVATVLFSDAASVSIDDGPPLEPHGKAVTINPGAHRFRIERSDGAVVTREITIDEGARLVRIDATVPVQRSHRGMIVGAAGVAGVATGSVLGLIARSRQHREQAECASTTDCRDHAAAERDYESAIRYGNASTIAFAAGGALIAVGVVIWIRSPKSQVTPVIGRDRAGVTFTRGF